MNKFFASTVEVREWGEGEDKSLRAHFSYIIMGLSVSSNRFPFMENYPNQVECGMVYNVLKKKPDATDKEIWEQTKIPIGKIVLYRRYINEMGAIEFLRTNLSTTEVKHELLNHMRDVKAQAWACEDDAVRWLNERLKIPESHIRDAIIRCTKIGRIRILESKAFALEYVNTKKGQMLSMDFVIPEQKEHYRKALLNYFREVKLLEGNDVPSIVCQLRGQFKTIQEDDLRELVESCIKEGELLWYTSRGWKPGRKILKHKYYGKRRPVYEKPPTKHHP